MCACSGSRVITSAPILTVILVFLQAAFQVMAHAPYNANSFSMYDEGYERLEGRILALESFVGLVKESTLAGSSALHLPRLLGDTRQPSPLAQLHTWRRASGKGFMGALTAEHPHPYDFTYPTSASRPALRTGPDPEQPLPSKVQTLQRDAVVGHSGSFCNVAVTTALLDGWQQRVARAGGNEEVALMLPAQAAFSVAWTDHPPDDLSLEKQLVEVLSRQAASSQVNGVVVTLAQEDDKVLLEYDYLRVSSQAVVDGVEFSYWMHTKNEKSLEAACQKVREQNSELERKKGNADKLIGKLRGIVETNRRKCEEDVTKQEAVLSELERLQASQMRLHEATEKRANELRAELETLRKQLLKSSTMLECNKAKLQDAEDVDTIISEARDLLSKLVALQEGQDKPAALKAEEDNSATRAAEDLGTTIEEARVLLSKPEEVKSEQGNSSTGQAKPPRSFSQPTWGARFRLGSDDVHWLVNGGYELGRDGAHKEQAHFPVQRF